jgi:hypothetical protein
MRARLPYRTFLAVVAIATHADCAAAVALGTARHALLIPAAWRIW